jgi:hypothetical protein
MKFAAMGLAISLALAGAPAFAQVGGPNHGPKPAVGGATTGPAAGAFIGGPAKKDISAGGTTTTKATTLKSAPKGAMGAATVTTGQTGTHKPAH